jgi:adenosine deaminase
VLEQDFADLAWAYFQKAHADGVHHAEVFFDPQVHESRGVPYIALLECLDRGIYWVGRQGDTIARREIEDEFWLKGALEMDVVFTFREALQELVQRRLTHCGLQMLGLKVRG